MCSRCCACVDRLWFLLEERACSSTPEYIDYEPSWKHINQVTLFFETTSISTNVHHGEKEAIESHSLDSCLVNTSRRKLEMSPASQSTKDGQGCPMNEAKSTDSSGPLNQPLWSMLWWGPQQLPAPAPPTENTTKKSSCPIASTEEAAKYAQTPQPNQRVSLGTDRQVSSIPRTSVEADGPHHQHDPEANKWVYPSEQQLYNAMIRKGWKNIPADSIPIVLQIHNTTNERTWNWIQSYWEGGQPVELVRFMGRPKDLTPKAFVYSQLLGGEAPFDRHDWYVSTPQGFTQRYVIDYYQMGDNYTYLDVRPALDHPRAAALRMQRFLQDAFPGITHYARKKWSSPNAVPSPETGRP